MLYFITDTAALYQIALGCPHSAFLWRGGFFDANPEADQHERHAGRDGSPDPPKTVPLGGLRLQTREDARLDASEWLGVAVLAQCVVEKIIEFIFVMVMSCHGLVFSSADIFWRRMSRARMMRPRTDDSGMPSTTPI